MFRIFTLALIGALLDSASGHGYMKSPRARNYVGFADGVWWNGDDETPQKENCPHCLNLGGTLARCGLTDDRNYDYPKNYFLDPMEWSTQTTYEVGSTIEIEAVLTAHHKGHMEVKACSVSPNEVATQSCFDSNPLEFVSDELYNAPKDVNYPGRAYIAPPGISIPDNTGVQGLLYKYKFKLPNTVSGHVLLQWYYVTGNSCTAKGYDKYPFPDQSWYTANLAECPHIPEDGIGVPEQFWNCAEVYIEGDIGPTKSPTAGPTVSATISSSPSAAVTASPTKPPTEPTDKNIIGYYASWQQYKRGGLGVPANMDFTKVDRVNFAFFQTNTDGYLYGTDDWGDPIALFGPENYNGGGTNHCSWDGPNQKNCANRNYEQGLIHLVHAAGSEIYPSIGGWTLSDAFPPMAADPVARARFAAQCAELVEAYDFDGIDIDWEYPGYADHSGTPADKQNFNLLLKEVRDKLDEATTRTNKQYGLTAALPCGPSHIDNIDVGYISGVLDELLLMTYDLHGSWDSVTGVNAPLYYQGFGDQRFSVDACVNAWKAGGAPSSKIGLGMPFYGRSFKNASGLNKAHGGLDDINWSLDDGIPQYYSIMDKMNTMTSVRHDVSKTPYVYFNNGSGFVSYDDERSICEKTEYLLDNDLKSFLIWELSGDLMKDLSTPLLDVMNTKLSNPDLNCAAGTLTGSPTSPKPTASPTGKRPTSSPKPTPVSTMAPTKAPSAEATCPSGYSGWIAVPANTCTHYQSCQNGVLTGNPLPCPSGTRYDENMQNCDYYYSVWCNGKPPEGVPICPTGFTGNMGVEECTGWRYCQSGIVRSPHYDCPDGQLFDKNTQGCNWEDQVTCEADRRGLLRGVQN